MRTHINLLAIKHRRAKMKFSIHREHNRISIFPENKQFGIHFFSHEHISCGRDVAPYIYAYGRLRNGPATIRRRLFISSGPLSSFLPFVLSPPSEDLRALKRPVVGHKKSAIRASEVRSPIRSAVAEARHIARCCVR